MTAALESVRLLEWSWCTKGTDLCESGQCFFFFFFFGFIGAGNLGFQGFCRASAGLGDSSRFLILCKGIVKVNNVQMTMMRYERERQGSKIRPY